MDGAGLNLYEVGRAKRETKDIETTRAYRVRVDYQEVGMHEPKFKEHDQVPKPVSCHPLLGL